MRRIELTPYRGTLDKALDIIASSGRVSERNLSLFKDYAVKGVEVKDLKTIYGVSSSRVHQILNCVFRHIRYVSRRIKE